MIVKDNSARHIIRFKGLEIGSLFLYDNRYYIRVLSSTIPQNSGKYNAVDVISGDFKHVNLDADVIQLEGEVVVR